MYLVFIFLQNHCKEQRQSSINLSAGIKNQSSTGFSLQVTKYSFGLFQFQNIIATVDPPPSPEADITFEFIGRGYTPMDNEADDKYNVPTLEELGRFPSFPSFIISYFTGMNSPKLHYFNTFLFSFDLILIRCGMNSSMINIKIVSKIVIMEMMNSTN